MRALGWVSILSFVGACSAPIVGTDAPPGLDAPATPDTPPTPDVFFPPDAPPAPCVVAGGTDADGDGACAATDCDDTDVTVSPDLDEVCTASAAGGVVPVDENCSGVVDEGCGWATGSLHVVVDVAVDATAELAPFLSADGLRLYYTRFTGTPAMDALVMTSRATRTSRFRGPTLVPLSRPAGAMSACGLSTNELLVVCAIDDALYVGGRADTSAPFGALTSITSTVDTADLEDPRISPDGTELYYARALSGGGHEVLVAPRSGTTFGTPVPVTISGLPAGQGARSPQLLADGRTLVFTSGLRVFLAYRETAGGFSFGGTTDVGPNATHAWYSAPTRELFLSRTGPWSLPTVPRMFRVQVCRDGACAPEPAPECPAGALDSPDGFHCFFRTATPLGRDAAAAACGAADAHLATIHSGDENALAAAAAGGMPGWIGFRDRDTDMEFRWPNDEPPFFQNFQAGDPDIVGTGSAILMGTPPNRWDDRSESNSFYGLCEVTVWPTW